MTTVGITTTPYGNNFGELMQAYALVTSIERLLPGHKAQVIDFTPVSRDFKIKHGFEDYAERDREKDRKFKDFRKKYLGLIGNPMHHISSENAPLYDIYVFGSNQIWNTAEKELIFPEFFGSFVPKGHRKVAYAASIGAKTDTLETDLFEKYMDTFDYISVREKHHVDFVKRFTKKEVKCVCDPTLLMEPADYDALLSDVKIEKPEKPYIFFYHPHAADGTMLAFVNKIARMHSMDVVYTFAKVPKKMFPYGSKSIRFAGPLEFLKFLKEADLVVTRSYHATCLSILFQKAFYAFADRKTGARIESLCEITGSTRHLVHHFMRAEDVDLNPDFSKVNVKLAKFRDDSKMFLAMALS